MISKDTFNSYQELTKTKRPISITSVDKIHIKADCSKDSILNGTREPILYNFAPVYPPGHKLYKEPRTTLFKKIKKTVLSYTTFYLEDDDHKSVDFNGKTIIFTHQLIKMKLSSSYKYVCMYTMV